MYGYELTAKLNHLRLSHDNQGNMRWFGTQRMKQECSDEIATYEIGTPCDLCNKSTCVCDEAYEDYQESLRD